MVDRVRMRRLQDDWVQERYGYRLDGKETTAWRTGLTEEERRLLGRWDQVTPTEEINALHSEDVDVDVLRTVLHGKRPAGEGGCI